MGQQSTSTPKKAVTASRFKKLRKLLGMSQRELAREFRVSPGAVALWEGGKRTVPGPISKLVEIYENAELVQQRISL